MFHFQLRILSLIQKAFQLSNGSGVFGFTQTAVQYSVAYFGIKKSESFGTASRCRGSGSLLLVILIGSCVSSIDKFIKFLNIASSGGKSKELDTCKMGKLFFFNFLFYFIYFFLLIYFILFLHFSILLFFFYFSILFPIYLNF